MRLLFSFLLALGIAGCDVFDNGPTTTVVEGNVIDITTGEPLSHIGVLLQSSAGNVARPTLAVDSTDAVGRFRVDHTQRGSQDVPYELSLWDLRLTDGRPNPEQAYFYAPQGGSRIILIDVGTQQTVTLQMRLTAL